MPVDIGIVGAGNRGQRHAHEYADIDGAMIAAVADIDDEAATALAEEYDIPSVYGDFRDMLDDAALDAVSVCVHNNLHAPVTIAAAEAGVDVFCEKAMAGSYADAEAMLEATESAGVHLGVQNHRLFSEETRAVRNLAADGRLGEIYYGRGVYSRRRGRPFVDGYGTPAFVSEETAGGGPVFDIGTYSIGNLLYLLGNADVERVAGQTFEFTEDAYDRELVGDSADRYRQRLEEAEYDVEDAGTGLVHLEDGSVLQIRTAWHMFHPDEPSVVVGSQGGVDLDSMELLTTTADYESTVSLDVDGYETRQALLESETGYEFERDIGQFRHFVRTVAGDVEDPVPTGEIALNSMVVMEGIYRSANADRELTAEEIAERSESTAFDV
jgi:predicted dehydrogenase